jgi:tetratricopeptide (TPR) repeat protein
MIAAAALIALLAAADPGAAGDLGGRPDDSSARALFERGEVKFNLGNFEGAAADYQAAYELDHRPALLFNVGQCYRNLENYERARFFYRRFLTLDPQTPNRRETESLIDLMSKRLDEQRAKVDLAARANEPASGAATPPAFAPSLPTLQRTEAPAADGRGQPVYRRTWFWVGVAGVVAGGVAAGLLLTRDDQHGSLASINVPSAGVTAP